MERVTPCNAAIVNGSEQSVLYWMTAYRRTHFNYALERAVFWATELRKPLLIFEPLACNYRWASIRAERPIFGLVRYMSSASTARKLGIKV